MGTNVVAGALSAAIMPGVHIRKLARRIAPRGCTYWGTFKITQMQTRCFTGSGSFQVDVSQHRKDEKQVLSWLSETMQETSVTAHRS